MDSRSLTLSTIKINLAITLLLTLCAVAGCAQSPADSQASAADRQAIAALRQQEMAHFSSGDVEGLLSLVTDDMVLMPPNEPALKGKEAARRWSQNMLSQFKIEGTYTSSADLTVAGDWAFERLAFTLKLTPVAGGAAIEEVGKGFHIYRRQPDGFWKIHQDIWNSDKPIAAVP